MVLPTFLNELYNTPSLNLLLKDQYDSKITLGVSLKHSGQETEPKIDNGDYLGNSGSPRKVTSIVKQEVTTTVKLGDGVLIV